MSKTPPDTLKNTVGAVEALQNFEPESLVRKDILGQQFCFEDAVKSAQDLIDLYKQIPTQALSDIPQKHLDKIRSRAESDFRIFANILSFQPTEVNAVDTRQSLISKLNSAYGEAFSELHPWISYATSRNTDFNTVKSDGLSAIKEIQGEKEKLTSELKKASDEAVKVLAEIRKTSAEQGVSQEAAYFQRVADDHKKYAKSWLVATVIAASLLFAYCMASFYFHKIDLIAPKSTYETVLLSISKVLAFSVLSYVVILFAKNYTAHRHNETVNRHRHSALQVYRALIDAAKDLQEKEQVLIHASACIFSPQPTAYIQEASSTGGSSKLVEMIIPKISTNLPSA